MHEALETFLAAGERLHRSSDAAATRRLHDAAEELHRGMQALLEESVTATDQGGHVDATVSLSGRLGSLHISAYAMRDLDAKALGAACQSAITAARSAAVNTFKERVGDFPAHLMNQDPESLVRRAYR